MFSDANRNKTVRAAGAAARRGSNQPDVVSGSVSKAASVQEISRLEALCEARTKELNYTKLQLKSRVQGFEAMTILVKYMTEEVSIAVVDIRKVSINIIKFLNRKIFLLC